MNLSPLRAAFDVAAQSMTRQEAIVEVLEKAISDGELPPRAKLPTVRALSTELNVSASTVVAAYNALRSQGWISGEVGRGTFVLGAERAEPIATPEPAVNEWSAPAASQRRPWRRRTVLTSANRLQALYPDALDCTRGKPDTSLILTEIVRRAWRKAADDAEPEDLQYSNPSPLPELRDALLPRLRRDGISTDGCEMVVGSSAQQLMIMSLGVTARLMPHRPRIVAVEEPGYQTVFDAFEYSGFRLVGLSVDNQGVTPESLDAALREGAQAALFTPCALNPKGVSWTRERRMALANVLAAHPHTIAIEDDQFADLALTRPGSLLDSPTISNRVIYIRTFAKAIAPDLRVAIALAKPRLANQIAEAKSLGDGWTSQHLQRALANVLVDPELESALLASQQAYARRRNTIAEILREKLRDLGAQITGSDGLNLWLRLPIGVAATEVVDHAASLGVLLVSGEPFYIRPGHNDVIRMSISGIRDDQAAIAAERLVEAIRTNISTATMSIPI